MRNLKKSIKKILPPIFIEFRNFILNNSNNTMWSGNYKNWEEANKFCLGYDNDIILSKCFEQMQKIKNGTKVYERDSVVFDEIQYSYGVLIGLFQSAANNNGQISVLDFGGSLGSSYFQNKEILKPLQIKWCVVEQENFTKCGKQNFETSELKFYSSIEECINYIQPKVLLLSSVIQYLENPPELLKKINNLKIETIIFDRTPFVDTNDSILTIQKVNDNIYNASYPSWFFNFNNFISEFSNYNLILNFDSYCDPSIKLNKNINASWKGFILNLKNK